MKVLKWIKKDIMNILDRPNLASLASSALFFRGLKEKFHKMSMENPFYTPTGFLARVQRVFFSIVERKIWADRAYWVRVGKK